MPNDGFVQQPGDRETLIRSSIRSWRDGLINLTGSNRLLNFRPSKTGMVELVRPSPGDVLTRLVKGGTYQFRSLKPKTAESAPGEETPGSAIDLGYAVPPPSADMLDTDKDPDDLTSALRSLYRRSNQEYLNRGLWVLYLAFGALIWTDEDGRRYTSPLLLVPVGLEHKGPRQMPVLAATEDDSALNPALALKLAERGIELPRVDDLEELSLAGILDAVRAAVAAQDGWQVSERLVLSYFSFAKEAMYRDLLGHEDLIAAHPAVAALAAGGRSEELSSSYFDEIPDWDVDRRAAPEDTPVILDADSSQRASVAAARDGRSFVMDGPPGTGKSQTIANMIGVLLHAGKTVLFVSEKAAALDVVRDRLDAAGLRAYLLELHSHKATRKEVAVALGSALDTILVPPASTPAIDVDAARKRREQLNAYADAMNRPRDPLGYSLHNVLGMIAKLQEVPAAPVAGIAPVNLTVEVFGEIRGTATKLAGAWRPAAQGRSFIWRGVAEKGSLDSRLYQAASSLEMLAGTARVNMTLAEATGLTRPSDAEVLAGLVAHLSARPPRLPDDWLTVSSLDTVDGAVAELTDELAAIADREDDVTRAAGISWSVVPRLDTLPEFGDAALAMLVPPATEIDSLTAEQIATLAATFAEDAGVLDKCLGSLPGLASMLGFRSPRAFGEVDDLLALAALVQEAQRPEPAWLSASGLAAAEEAARVLNAVQQALAKAEADASTYYTPAALGCDLPGLAQRFENEHHHLGKLSTKYRADKKTVATFTREGVSKAAAHRHLGLAVAWKQAADTVAAAETAHAPALGAYYSGRSTDFSPLDRALAVAATAVRRAHGQDLARFADCATRDATPSPVIATIADDIRRGLNDWQAALTSRPATAARPELLGGTLSEAAGWMRAHLGPLAEAAAFTQAVSEAVGRPLTASQSRHLVALRDAADTAHARLAGRTTQFSDTFGGLYAGPRTDMGAVRSALEWARCLRAKVTGTDAPLTPAQVKAADGAIPAGHLATAADKWCRARDALLESFGADRRQDLAAELDDYEDTAELIAALRQDTGGKDEWHAYGEARTLLAAHGLDVAIDFCISERIPSSQVAEVIERALLQEWAEHHLRTDPDLSLVRAADRDALVSEYRKLDRALITAATGTIIRACNARRPRSDIGESAIIHREAEKKKKHMPVRTLIERSRHVTQAIKPCFMMSPLAVSQYLPADLHFDLVIFDEASQVSPGDAINCIYRGSALILAGDQKQLPPSNFFAAASADDDEWSEDSEDAGDFESILDLMKASGAYRSLTLRWHYRSLHEALIAFSNATFYKGQLVTFPSMHSDGPDVGIELFPFSGTYRRGTSRDNPEEAAKVAQRVIHHYDTRPALSLGVVTFSETQAEAIETAVSNARRSRPDLDRFFGKEDRLHGFFVKSLESVQGDERDVLIFSVGYGPDENRKITMNFGPLNKQGGWRRLNVAITRARYRNEIVSSIRPGDIPESVTTEGVRHLRHYLDYAERGMPALALDTSAGGDAESPFEESVISVIRSWGYELVPQVGTAGYRIDIGVCHPAHPGVYALGVECDGYQYHSSKVARDRDRLREKVLRGLGWNLHRIWGTAWYRDRNGEERKLRAAIEGAIAAPVRGLLSSAGAADADSRLVVETEAAAFDQVPAWATPYVTADVPRLPHWIDPSQPGSAFDMAPRIEVVVLTEQPVHIAVLRQRLRDAWNIGRIGSRIRENIDTAITVARVLRDGDFLTLSRPPLVTVRTPTEACRRDVEQVHDRELTLALVNLVRDAGGITGDELSTRIARLYGWTRRGPDITARMDTLISALLATGTLTGNPDNLKAS
jgi:very-short-patch-repair endonuclease